MTARLAHLSDKTSSAPYFANSIRFRRIPRFRPFDFFDIMLVTGGTGTQVSYRSSQPRNHPVQPGTLVLYRPIDDLYLTSTSAAELAVTYVSFPVAEWTTFAHLVGVEPGWATAEDPPTVTIDPMTRESSAPFDRAREKYWAGTATSLDLVQFWIDVIPLLFPGSHPRLALGAPRWLADALEQMRDEENLRGGIARLLELANVTAAHLSATVRRYHGKTPTALVLEMRLRHAAVLLGDSTESIGQIASRCGFRSFPYFSTAFRNQYGVVPRQFRARVGTRFAVSLAQRGRGR